VSALRGGYSPAQPRTIDQGTAVAVVVSSPCPQQILRGCAACLEAQKGRVRVSPLNACSLAERSCSSCGLGARLPRSGMPSVNPNGANVVALTLCAYATTASTCTTAVPVPPHREQLTHSTGVGRRGAGCEWRWRGGVNAAPEGAVSCVAWVCASNSCKYVLLNREATARASIVVSSPVCGYSAPSRVRCGLITQHIHGHMPGSIRPSFTSHSRANLQSRVLFLPAWVVCPTSHHCRVCVVQRGCVLHWAAQPPRFPVATPLVKIDLG
jgi:hypothetical protein